jgi:hypothetical protein
MSSPDAFQVGVALLIVGVSCFLVGFALVVLSFKYVKKAAPKVDKGTIQCTALGSDARMYAFLLLQVQDLREDISVKWREQQDKEVICRIMDYLPGSPSGIYVNVYSQGKGSQGQIDATLQRGNYSVDFRSLARDTRAVEYEMSSRRHYLLFEKYRQVGLTLLTIGTVLAVNGLALVLRS